MSLDELQQKGSTATLEEHQQALYALLQEFDRVAGILKTPYFLFAGTLLGAVRHQGFIPWDDDLDVIMRREDYDRFLRQAPELINEDVFFLQAEFTEHWPMFFSKLRLNGTTCLEKFHPKDAMIHQGVYMDIFPCDNAYQSRIGRIVQFLASKVIIAKGLDKRGYENRTGLRVLFMTLCRYLPSKLFVRLVKGPNKKTRIVHSFLGAASKYSKNVYPACFFEKSVLLKFGERHYLGPEKYDDLLKVLYGEYMKLPPEEERKIKQHAILVDLKKPYQVYEHYRDGLEFDVQTRSIR